MTSSSTVVYIVEGIFASLILLIPIIFYYHFRNNNYQGKKPSDNALYKDRYYRNLLAIMLVLFLANGIFLFVYSFQEEYRLAN